MHTLYQDGFSIIPILCKVNDDFTKFVYFVKLHNFLHFLLAIVYKLELIMSVFHERIAPLIMRERKKGVSDSTMEKAMGLPDHSIKKSVVTRVTIEWKNSRKRKQTKAPRNGAFVPGCLNPICGKMRRTGGD